MPMNRREFVASAVAGAAVLQREVKGFAVAEGTIQVRIDASVSGAPINPMIFGGYMEPATTQVWAEVLTDRKFANAITSAPTPPPANPFFRRFFGEPFKPVGPEGTVEMDAERAYVGKHSPRVKLDSSEPHGIRQNRLRISGGKTYEGRVVLAGDPSAKVVVRLIWGPGDGSSQTITIPPLAREYKKIPLKFAPGANTEEAKLEILGTGAGTFHVGAVSLMLADNVQGFHSGMIRLCWNKYVEKMPWLKESDIKFIFDEWGNRPRSANGQNQPLPGMLGPLSYALCLHEMFRHSDKITASCATGGLRLLTDITGDAVGFPAEGVVMKLMQTRFLNAVPVVVDGDSPQQQVYGTDYVDKGPTPTGSPTYPLDVLAAFSGDRKRFLISVVNPTEDGHSFTPRIRALRLRDRGKLQRIAPPSVNSANEVGKEAVVKIDETEQTGMPETIRVPPISISLYEFEVETT